MSAVNLMESRQKIAKDGPTNLLDKYIEFLFVYENHFNPSYSYVKCDSTSVFISGAPLSSTTRHSFSPTLICEMCERKPGLHPENCFKIYHALKNYKIQQ